MVQKMAITFPVPVFYGLKKNFSDTASIMYISGRMPVSICSKVNAGNDLNLPAPVLRHSLRTGPKQQVLHRRTSKNFENSPRQFSVAYRIYFHLLLPFSLTVPSRYTHVWFTSLRGFSYTCLKKNRKLFDVRCRISYMRLFGRAQVKVVFLWKNCSLMRFSVSTAHSDT